jgi:hypothetical protein
VSCGGKTENGANCSLFGASKALRNYGPKRLKLAFSGPFFFASFLFGQAKRNEDKGWI